MAFEVVPYQNLTYRTTVANPIACGKCPNPVYIDKTRDFVAQVGITPYSTAVECEIFSNGGAITLDNLTESPTGTYCYDRDALSPYTATYTQVLGEGGYCDGQMGEGQYTQINFTYTSNVLFYCTIELQDSTTAVITTQTFELPAAFSSADVTKYFYCSVLDAAGYFIVIRLYSSTVEPTASFCFSDLTGYPMTQVGEVTWTDCNGDETDLTDLTDAEFFGDTELLTIDISGISGEGYLTFTEVNDPSNQFLLSSTFNAIDPSTYAACRLGQLTKLLWRQSCNLENLATTYTSIEYSMYVQGYTERLPLVTDERVTFTEPGGRKRTVFNYSYAPAFLKVGVYDIATHENIERAVESSYFAINDDEYQLDDSSTYTIAPLNNGLFTGRVEMIKIGTERVLADCCCPVNTTTPECGCLTITDICTVAFLRVIRYELCGITTGTQIDFQIENIDAIEDSPCAVAAGTIVTVTDIGDIGGFVGFTPGDWNDLFTDNYCDYTDIRYSVRIRVNCGATHGEWSDPIVIVPDDLTICEGT